MTRLDLDPDLERLGEALRASTTIDLAREERANAPVATGLGGHACVRAFSRAARSGWRAWARRSCSPWAGRPPRRRLRSRPAAMAPCW